MTRSSTAKSAATYQPAQGELVLFTTSWCPFCTRLIAGLQEAEINFTEIDVDADQAAATFVESVNNGNRIVPTVRFADGTVATNPPAKQVIRLSGQK